MYHNCSYNVEFNETNLTIKATQLDDTNKHYLTLHHEELCNFPACKFCIQSDEVRMSKQWPHCYWQYRKEHVRIYCTRDNVVWLYIIVHSDIYNHKTHTQNSYKLVINLKRVGGVRVDAQEYRWYYVEISLLIPSRQKTSSLGLGVDILQTIWHLYSFCQSQKKKTKFVFRRWILRLRK